MKRVEQCMLFKALAWRSFVLRDNQVLCQLTAKPKANARSQLNFWAICQLSVKILAICQLSVNPIQTLNRIKLLGVTTDDQLNFNIHINEICKRASQRVGVMMRLKKLIPTNAKLTLHKSAILPYLTYCHLTWHLCTACNKRKLERMQEIENTSWKVLASGIYARVVDVSEIGRVSAANE